MPQAGTTRTVLLALLVATLALAVRLSFIAADPEKHAPGSLFFSGDALRYHQEAVDLVQGREPELPYFPPLYPRLLAAVYALTGAPEHSAWAHKLGMVALNVVTTVLAWRWWRVALGPELGWICAAAMILHFGMLVVSASYNSEGLYLLLLTLILSLVWTRSRELAVGPAIVLGILMGLASLTRAEHFSLWPFLLAYLGLMRDRGLPWRRHLEAWLVSLAVSGLVLLPSALHNRARIDALNRAAPALEPLSTFAPVSIYGPANFALANGEYSDGGFRPDLLLLAGDGRTIDVTGNAKQRYLFIHGYREGGQWLARNPRRALLLMLAKLDRWTDGLALGFGVSDWPGGLSGSRPPVDLFVPDRGGLKLVFGPLLLAGMAVSTLPRYRRHILMTLVVLHRALITLVFFGYARGLVVVLPAVIPLVALPGSILVERWPKLRRVTLVVAAAGLACGVLQAAVVAREGTRRFLGEGTVDPLTNNLNPDGGIRLRPEAPP